MKSLLNLLRSMRFAVAILSVVAIAATIGSVLEQSQGMVVYVRAYGEFWAEVLTLAGLTDVYHAWWFFTLLAFMAASTALCLAQNTPQMLYEMRAYRENKSLQSLRRLPQRAEMDVPVGSRASLAALLEKYLRQQGFAYLRRQIGDGEQAGTLFAARRGNMRRLGYLLVHAAIVLICVGGLIDGNVVLRWQLLSGARQVESRDLAPALVPPRSRLAADAGSFRATMNLVEGSTENTAYLSFNEGYLLQELPFSVRLKQFRVEHYDNFDSGRPRDFASDIEILDGGKVVPVTLHVNHPYTYRGISLYQSGFADGGSALSLQAIQHGGTYSHAAVTELQGKVGASSPLLIDGQPFTLEFTEFKASNVFEKEEVALSGADTRSNWFSTQAARDRMEDVGPSLSFRLRDKQGQAVDWLVYRKPIQVGNLRYLVLAKREPQQDRMHYLRLPLGQGDSLDAYLAMSRQLSQPAARRKAAQSLAADIADRGLAGAFEQSTLTLLNTFSERGYRGLAELVQNSVPEAERAKASRFYAELLERAAFSLMPEELRQATASNPAVPKEFMHDSLVAYSDAREAGFSMLFRFAGYQQVNASGLQLTRAPGAVLVYLGSALLALGVCAMYFIRERRMWLWIAPGKEKLFMAFSGNRYTPVLQQEFDGYQKVLSAQIAPVV